MESEQNNNPEQNNTAEQNNPPEQNDMPEIWLPKEPKAEAAPESVEEPAGPELPEYDEYAGIKPAKRPPVGCLHTVSYCLLITGLSILLAAFIILASNDMFALVKEDREVTVTIENNATLRNIADELHEEGVIRYPSLFWLFARLAGMDSRVEPGVHTLNADMDYRSLLSAIRYKAAARETVTVTVPEGMIQDDIFALLEENGVCPASELAAYAKYYDFTYSFLEGLPYSDKRLEGYLFPDTYEFYVGDTPVRVLKRFLSNFSRKWDVDMKARADNINTSIRDVLIIASMIEREAKFDDERPLIASVIHNRLRSTDFPYLQIDATVHYALPEYKEVLSADDLLIDSPYNTYLYSGLPVGPICNPGLAAIRAALYPEESDYYYYVARKNGWHYFAATNAEHKANIERVNTESADTEEPVSRIEG